MWGITLNAIHISFILTITLGGRNYCLHFNRIGYCGSEPLSGFHKVTQLIVLWQSWGSNSVDCFLSRQLQQPPVLESFPVTPRTPLSLSLSPACVAPMKVVPNCLLVSRCVWSTVSVGRRWERGRRVRPRFSCSPPQLSPAALMKSELLSTQENSVGFC